jgi:hypothetical protein
MIKTLTLTPTLRAAIDSVDRAQRAARPGCESASLVELLKLGLADELLLAIAAQAGVGRVAALERLPKARAVSVVEPTPRRRRRRRAG